MSPLPDSEFRDWAVGPPTHDCHLNPIASALSDPSCGGWAHVAPLGYAQPDPVSEGPATRHSPVIPNPRPGSRVYDEFFSKNNADQMSVSLCEFLFSSIIAILCIKMVNKILFK